MKIALVYDAVYPWVKGGGERRFYEIGKRLSKNNEVHIYGMKLWEGEKVIQKEGIFYHGLCKAIPLYTKENKRSIYEAVYFGISAIKLLKEDFDAVDCSGFPYFSLFSVKIVCLIKGKKLYSTWHEVWGKEYWKEYLGKLWLFGYAIEKLSVKLPNRIIAVSENTKKQLIEKLKVDENKIIVVNNGIDINEINQINPSKSSDIIYAGRLLSHKNINILIQAVFILKKSKEYNKIKCIIVGGGPELNNLKHLAKSLNLEKNIIFTDYLEDFNDALAFMKSSKVFVIPSTREGFGIVVIEANACGIPAVTISHKDNASKDLIKHNINGFITNLNPESLADKIKICLKEYKSMKEDCIAEAKRYDWDEIAEELEGMYGGEGG